MNTTLYRNLKVRNAVGRNVRPNSGAHIPVPVRRTALRKKKGGFLAETALAAAAPTIIKAVGENLLVPAVQKLRKWLGLGKRGRGVVRPGNSFYRNGGRARRRT